MRGPHLYPPPGQGEKAGWEVGAVVVDIGGEAPTRAERRGMVRGRGCSGGYRWRGPHLYPPPGQEKEAGLEVGAVVVAIDGEAPTRAEKRGRVRGTGCGGECGEAPTYIHHLDREKREGER